MQPLLGSLPILRLAQDSTPGLLLLSKGGFLSRLLEGDQTVPGTTEGIVMMGILIVVIIVIPIVWTRRKWMR